MKLSSNQILTPLVRNLKQGFTLIEVIVVMAIIASLAAIGFGVFFQMNNSAREKETAVIINTIASAMDARAADISAEQRDLVGIVAGFTYPSGDGTENSTIDLVRYIAGDFDGDGATDQGADTKMSNLLAQESGKSSLLDEQGRIIDSWKTPIRYTFPGNYHNEDDGFDLESAGPDREFGSGEDDDLARDNIILK